MNIAKQPVAKYVLRLAVKNRPRHFNTCLESQKSASRNTFSLRKSQAIRSSSSDELELVKREEKEDGTVLFVFGTEAEKAAQKPPEKAPEEPKNEAPQSSVSSTVASIPVQPTEAATSQIATEAPSNGAGSDHSTKPEKTPEPSLSAVSQTPAAPQSSNGDTQDSEEPPPADKTPLADKVPTATTGSFDRESLDELKVVELRDICKDNGIQGYSKLKKDELIELIMSELKQPQT